jgi:molecular chaperone DnaK
LSKEEIDKMRRDADLHADDDKKKREEIEVRNEADAAVYRSDKMFKDNLDKLSESDRAQIEEAAQKTKNALASGEVSAMKSASQRLNQVWQAASAALYRTSSAKAANGPSADHQNGAAQSQPKDEDVVEGELVEEESRR